MMHNIGNHFGFELVDLWKENQNIKIENHKKYVTKMCFNCFYLYQDYELRSV